MHRTPLEQDVMKYQKARALLEVVRKKERLLTVNEARELREQALNGDVDGAVLKLQDILITRFG